VAPADNEFTEGLLPVQLGEGKSVYLRTNGKVAFAVDAQYVDHFSDGLAVIVTGDIYKCVRHVIDHSGKIVIPETFNSLSGFSEGVAIASDPDGTQRIIDKHGLVMGKLDTPLLLPFCEGVSRMGCATEFPKDKYDREVENNCIPLETLIPRAF